MKSTFIGMVFLLSSVSMTTGALAGETYVDRSGYAVSGYDVVAFFDMKQAAVGEKQPAAVPGNKLIYATYNGASYAFSTMENRARFMADPGRYAPQFDGHCAYSVLSNVKQPGNPHHWRIVGDKLYLMKKESVVPLWENKFFYNINAANDVWPEIASDLASRDKVIGMEIDAAPYEG